LRQLHARHDERAAGGGGQVAAAARSMLLLLARNTRAETIQNFCSLPITFVTVIRFYWVKSLWIAYFYIFRIIILFFPIFK
jgi:hypothetical protein